MRRRQGDRSSIIVELSEDVDEPAGPEAPGGPGGPGGVPDEHADPAVRRRRRLRWVAAAAAAVVVVGGGAVVDRQAEARATAARVEQPGGLLPLDGPPRDTWSVTLHQSWDVPRVVGGSVVLVGQDGVVTAHDPSDGTVRWTADLGGEAGCDTDGQLGWGKGARLRDTGDSLTCLVEGDVLVVLDAEGEEQVRRALDPAPDRDDPTRALTVTGGLVVRVARTGAVPEGSTAVVDPETWQVRGTVRGRDVTVQAQDARTGEVRWTTTLPFVARDDALDCVVQGDAGGPVIETEPVSVWPGRDVVSVGGCGVRSVLSLEGARLDTPGFSTVVSLGDRVLRESDSGARGELADRDGATLFAGSGRVLVPATTDGTSDLVVVAEGSRTTGFGPDGEPRWTVPSVHGSLLAQDEDAVVLGDQGGRVVALDERTGEVRWETDLGVRDADRVADPGPVVQGIWAADGEAFADGTSLVVVLRSRGGTSQDVVRLVALDPADGTTRWDVASPRWTGAVVAVDGRLALVDAGSVAGLG